MADATRDRPGGFKNVTRDKRPLGANVKAIKGTAAVVDTRAASPTRGYVIPATAAEDLVAIGRFTETVDNTGGANGALRVGVEYTREFKCLRWNNSVVNPITVVHRGSLAYFEDNQTVGNDATGRSSAGRIYDLEDGQVLVEVMS